MRKSLTIVALFAAMIFVATPAGSSTWSGNFTSDHMTDGAGTPPFGKVVLTENASNVLVEVSLFDGSEFINTGAGGGYNFVFNATGVAVSDLSGTGLTFYGPPSSPIHADGTGFWDFGIVFTGQGTGGSNALPGPINFTVQNASIADLIVGNGSYIFAADIISGQTGNTGLVDVENGTYVTPEPASMILLGLGLAGLAALRRKTK